MDDFDLERFGFKKSHRLGSREEFRAVLSRKCCVYNELAKLYVAENGCGYPRIGISIGKSTAKSVVRNRLKRLLREVFRLEQHSIPSGFDYLLILSGKWSKKTKLPSCLPGTGPDFDGVRVMFLALVNRAVSKAGRK